MIFEGLVLVALFDIALLPGGLAQRGGVCLDGGVAVGKPPSKIHALGAEEFGLQPAEEGQRDGAVRLLGALRLDEVDRGVADKVGDEEVVRAGIDLQRRLILLQDAVVDQADLRGKGHGLHLVVCNIDKGRAGLDVQTLQLIAHLETQLGVEVAERLVHEQDGRLRSQGAGDGHALLLAAGELGRVAVHEHADLDDAADAAHREVDLLLGELAHLFDDLAVFDILKLLVQPVRGHGLLGLSGKSGGLGGDVPALLNVVGKELFRRVLGDGILVDQLDDSLLLVKLALFVAAFLHHALHVRRVFQDLRQTGVVLRLEIDLRHGFLDVGQAEGDVLVDGHIRPERVVLEQEAHLALVGRDVDAERAVVHDAVADGDAAAGRRLEAGDHAKGRGFAAAGGAQQRDEGVVVDGQVQIIDRIKVFPPFGDMFQFDFRHFVILLFPCRGSHP